MKSVVQPGFFHKFAFDNKALKSFFESVENVQSSNVVEFELRHIPILREKLVSADCVITATQSCLCYNHITAKFNGKKMENSLYTIV